MQELALMLWTSSDAVPGPVVGHVPEVVTPDVTRCEPDGTV